MEALKPNFASQFDNSGIPPEVIRCAKNLLTSDVAKEMAVTAKRLISPPEDDTSRLVRVVLQVKNCGRFPRPK